MFSFAEGLREEMRQHGVSVTALLPGTTATDFHQRAEMHDTKFRDNSWKNDPALVARLGVDALFADRDHVIGAGSGTRWSAILNKFSPEAAKAHRFAKGTRPL